ncbi:MAG: FtsW/RodA/SpoVE family cell cycle protein [Firmicutes bacterium]|nr:FtsW/RodA/SpoVE family cell cycle protein [Bacillota bacterium]
MRKFFSKIDIPLLILMVLYSAFGLLMIYSASSVSAVIRYQVPHYNFFLKQALFLGATFIIGFSFILKFPTRNYKALVWPLIIGVIVALGMLFVHGKITGDGIKSWYDLKFFSLQPSEFAKTILILFSAVFYHDLHQKKIKNIYVYLIPFAITLLIVGLIIMQPDFGSAIIVLGIGFFIFISIPNVNHNLIKVIKIIALAVIIGGIALIYSGQEILNRMQIDRFTFQDPCSRYTEATGYQVCNGFVAIKNGGILGSGLGNSTQKYLYLPESHTDFIFPIIVEECGLLMGIAVILGYGYMLYRILKIAFNSETLRCSILAYGTFWYLSIHILINLLGVLALIPLTGVPLPLLSYGGSYAVNVVGMLFVVQRVNIENKINKTKREIKSL